MVCGVGIDFNFKMISSESIFWWTIKVDRPINDYKTIFKNGQFVNR